MASPLELLNQASYDGRTRRGVTYMPPVRLPAARAAAPVAARGANVSPDETASRWLTPDLQGIANYAPPKAAAAGGGNQFGGLGYLIGGAGKVAMGALDALDMGRRASVLGVEGLANALPERAEWLAPITKLVNENRDEDRSAWERFRDPSYGWGQIANQIDTGHGSLDRWLNRGYGLAGDIALDPLTYLTFGVDAIPGKAGRAAELGKLLEAQKILEPEALAKLGETARATTAETEMLRGLGFGDEAAGTLPIGEELLNAQKASTANLDWANDLTSKLAPYGGQGALGGEAELSSLFQSGVSAANPAQLEAMGLRQHGVRFAGREIPGTEGISRALSKPAQALRPVARGVPGAAAVREATSKLGYMDQPLHGAYERLLTGQGPSTATEALEALRWNEMAREAGGTFEGLANRQLRILHEQMKGLSDSERAAAVRAAERGEDNMFSRYAAAVRDAAKEAGVELPELQPIGLAGGGTRQYAMPHVLSRDFRDYLQAAAKGKYDLPAAEPFKREAGITTENLLEEGGFLQSRRFTPKLDGTPNEYKFGDRTISIEEGTVDELNRKFKALFPEFKGNVYETDPIVAWRRYIQATRKDVANRGASKRALEGGFSGYFADPGAPGRYDPFGGRSQVTTRQTEEGEVPVTIPAANPKAPMTAEQEQFYKSAPNEKATLERNRTIGRDTDVKRAREHYAQESLAGREKIATGLDELRDQVYDPIRSELTRLEEVQGKGVEKAGYAIERHKELIARREQIPKDLARTTREINGIERQIDKIRSETVKGIPAKQKAVLDELEARRLELLQQRKDLTEWLNMDLETAPQGSLVQQQLIKYWSRREVEGHTTELHEAARKARQAYDDEVARLMSTTPGVLQPEQIKHYKQIAANAPPEIRDTAGRRTGTRTLAQNRARSQEELEAIQTELATHQRTLMGSFEKMNEQELGDALVKQRQLKESEMLYKREVENLDAAIKETRAGHEVALSREEADYDEAVRRLYRHNNEVNGAGGILEGAQPLLYTARQAEHNLADWQSALRSYRAPDRAAAEAGEAAAEALTPAQQAARELLATPEAAEMQQRLDRLAQIETERGQFADPAELQKTITQKRKELRVAKAGKPPRGATAPERMEWRNGRLRRIEQTQAELDMAIKRQTQSKQALGEYDAEVADIQKWLRGRGRKALRNKVETARNDLVAKAEQAAPEAAAGAESAAERSGRMAELSKLRRNRDNAMRLREQALTRSTEEIPPSPVTRVRGGWYKTEDGFQIVRDPRGAWVITKPGEFTPPEGDMSRVFGTFENAKNALSEMQANPEYMKLRQSQASRVPEFDKQIANLERSIAEREVVDRPLLPPSPTPEKTLREPPPRGLPEAPGERNPELRRIERGYGEAMKTQTPEAQQEAILREHFPAIHMTEQELGTVVSKLGGTVEGEGVDELGNKIVTKMPRAEQETSLVAINEARDAMDSINNLTGQQEALRAQQRGLRAEQEAIPQGVEGEQQALLRSMREQEDARAANEAIKAKTGPFTAPDVASRKVKMNRGQAKAFGTKLEAVKAGSMAASDAQPLNTTLVQIDELIKANPLGQDADMLRLQRISEGFRDEMGKLTTETDIPAHDMERMIKAAKQGKLAPIVDHVLQDGIARMWEGGDVLVKQEVYDMFHRVREGAQSKGFGRLMKLYTDFFKTYATLSPGFHVRNAMSAIFMNFTEGVSAGTQSRGLSLWREFAQSEEPITWLSHQTPEVRQAFRSVFASGSGGQFFEAGVGELALGSTRIREGIFQNKLTKGSQRIGQDWVEGPVRLGLALHVTERGGGTAEALQRITRIHFDYSQVSSFDEKAKKYIPFWTYMSRNMPLQVTQMWTKPKVYAWFNSVRRNFEVGEPNPLIPEYIGQAGGFQTGLTPGWVPGTGKNLPFVVQPDLPQFRLGEDIARFAQAASGQNAGQLLSDFNPAFTAPAEFLTGQDFYTGRKYKNTDIGKAGVWDLPLLPIAAMLGETKTGPGGIYISDKARNTGRALLPPYDRLVRMLPGGAGGGGDDQRQLESFLRFLGVPVRTVSDKQQESEAYRRAKELQDQARLNATLQQAG